jgi:hypothetical protein
MDITSLAKSLIEIRDEVRRVQAIADVSQKLIDAQAKANDAQREVERWAARCAQLEAEIALLDAWNAVAARYELRQLTDGGIVYAAKKEALGSDPMHFVCPDCFNQKKRFFLQFRYRTNPRGRTLKCLQCNFEVASSIE